MIQQYICIFSLFWRIKLLACLAYVRIQSENHKHELLTVTVYMFTDAITCVSDSREMKQYIRRNLQQV